MPDEKVQNQILPDNRKAGDPFALFRDPEGERARLAEIAALEAEIADIERQMALQGKIAQPAPAALRQALPPTVAPQAPQAPEVAPPSTTVTSLRTLGAGSLKGLLQAPLDVAAVVESQGMSKPAMMFEPHAAVARALGYELPSWMTPFTTVGELADRGRQGLSEMVFGTPNPVGDVADAASEIGKKFVRAQYEGTPFADLGIDLGPFGKINVAETIGGGGEQIGKMPYYMIGPSGRLMLGGKAAIMSIRDARRNGYAQGLRGEELERYAFMSGAIEGLSAMVFPTAGEGAKIQLGKYIIGDIIKDFGKELFEETVLANGGQTALDFLMLPENRGKSVEDAWTSFVSQIGPTAAVTAFGSAPASVAAAGIGQRDAKRAERQNRAQQDMVFEAAEQGRVAAEAEQAAAEKVKRDARNARRRELRAERKALAGLDDTAVRDRAQQIYERRTAENREGTADGDWVAAQTELVKEALHPGVEVPQSTMATEQPAATTQPDGTTNTAIPGPVAQPVWTEEQTTRLEGILSDKAKFPSVTRVTRVAPGSVSLQHEGGAKTLVTVALPSEMSAQAKSRKEASAASGQGTPVGLTLQFPAGPAMPVGYDSIVYLAGGEFDSDTVAHEVTAHRAVSRFLGDAQLDTLAKWARQQGVVIRGNNVKQAAFEEDIVSKIIVPALNGKLGKVPGRIETMIRKVGRWITDVFHATSLYNPAAPLEVREAAVEILGSLRDGTLFQGTDLGIERSLTSRETLLEARGKQANKAASEAAKTAGMAAKSASAEARQTVAEAKREAAPQQAALIEQRGDAAELRAKVESVRLGGFNRLTKLNSQDQQLVVTAIERAGQDQRRLGEIIDSAAVLANKRMSDFHDSVRASLASEQDTAAEPAEGGTFEVKTLVGDLPDEQAVIAALKRLPKKKRDDMRARIEAGRIANAVLKAELGPEGRGRAAMVDSIVKHGQAIDDVEFLVIDSLKKSLRRDIKEAGQDAIAASYSAQLDALNKVDMESRSERGRALNFLKTLQDERTSMEEIRDSLMAELRKPTKAIARMPSGPAKDSAIEALFQRRYEKFVARLHKFGYDEGDLFKEEYDGDGRFMNAVSVSFGEAAEISRSDKIAYGAAAAIRSFLIGPRSFLRIGLASALNSARTIAALQAPMWKEHGVAKLAKADAIALGSAFSTMFLHLYRTAMTGHNSAYEKYTGESYDATAGMQDSVGLRERAAIASSGKIVSTVLQNGFTLAAMADQVGQTPLGVFLAQLNTDPDTIKELLLDAGAQRNFSDKTALGQFGTAIQRVARNITGDSAWGDLGVGGLFPFIKGAIRGGELTVRSMPGLSIAAFMYDRKVAQNFKALVEKGMATDGEFSRKQLKSVMQGMTAIMMSGIAPLLMSLMDDDDLDDIAKGVVPERWGFPESMRSIDTLPFLGAIARSEAYAAQVVKALSRGQEVSERLYPMGAQILEDFAQEMTGFNRFGTSVMNFKATGDAERDKSSLERLAKGSTLGRIVLAATKPEDMQAKVGAALDALGGARDWALLASRLGQVFGKDLQGDVEGAINESRKQMGREANLDSQPIGYWLGMQGRDIEVKAGGETVKLSPAKVALRDRTVRRWGGEGMDSALKTQLNDYWENNFRLNRSGTTAEARAIGAVYRAKKALRDYAGTPINYESDLDKLPEHLQARADRLYNEWKRIEDSAEGTLEDYRDKLR